MLVEGWKRSVQRRASISSLDIYPDQLELISPRHIIGESCKPYKQYTPARMVAILDQVASNNSRRVLELLILLQVLLKSPTLKKDRYMGMGLILMTSPVLTPLTLPLPLALQQPIPRNSRRLESPRNSRSRSAVWHYYL